MSGVGVQTDRTCLCKWQAPRPQCVFADAGTRLMLSTAAVTAVGFEPTPLRTGDNQRLRPLGQTVMLPLAGATSSELTDWISVLGLHRFTAQASLLAPGDRTSREAPARLAIALPTDRLRPKDTSDSQVAKVLSVGSLAWRWVDGPVIATSGAGTPRCVPWRWSLCPCSTAHFVCT